MGFVYAGVLSYQAQLRIAPWAGLGTRPLPAPGPSAAVVSPHRQLYSDHKRHHPATKPRNGKALPPLKGPCCRLVAYLPNGTLIAVMTNLEIIASASPAVSDSHGLFN